MTTFNPKAAPTPQNYQQWLAARDERTLLAIANSKDINTGKCYITGKQIRQEMLGQKMLIDQGFVLDQTTDTYIK